MGNSYTLIFACATLVYLVMLGKPGSALGLAPQTFAYKVDDPKIPKEPGWKDSSYRGWELMSIPGLILTYYDLDSNGELDYMVIRKVLRKVDAEKTTMEEAIAIAKTDHVSVYFSHPVIYFAGKYPLYYCIGLDHRLNCKIMWVDISEDGLNGNESLYTPSTYTPHVR